MTRVLEPAAPALRPSTRLAPYVGPRPFTREDVRSGIQLYGRYRDVEHLVDLLASRRIVLLYSPSGAGKSSLIHAKLIGALEADQYYVLPVVRVGPAPRIEGTSESAFRHANRYVLTTLQCLEGALPAEERTPAHELARLDLPTWFDRLPVPDARFPIVVFDQFEEVLTADPTDREAKESFFAQLGTVLRNRERWALFAMREDFVAALDPYRNLLPTRLRETYRLDLLNEAAALEAITEPAKQAGVPFSDDAARKLVDELRLTKVERPDGSTDTVKGDYVEPVQLQVVCLSLWQRLPRDVSQITLAQVQQFGDVNQALADFYERTLAITSRSAHVRVSYLRHWFGTRLITSGGTRGLVYRGAQVTADLNNRAVDTLEEHHLIRAETRAGARWYELTHDRLVQPIQASNAAWERKLARKMALAAAAAVLALAMVAAAPVILSQQAKIASQSEVAENTSATATVDKLALQDAAATAEVAQASAQQVGATATISSRSAELISLANEQARIAEGTATAAAIVTRMTAVALTKATSYARAIPQVAGLVVPRSPSQIALRGPLPSSTLKPVEALQTPPPAVLTQTPTPAPPASTPTLAPTAPRTPMPAVGMHLPTFVIGASVKNTPLVVTRVGSGTQRMAIIGSLHGGEELAAYDLLTSFQRRLAASELSPPGGLSVYTLPSLNPDDLESKTGFNARGVDLNRNFDVLWTPVTCGSANGRYRAFGGCKVDGGGQAAFSEPESDALRTFILGEHIETVLVVNSGLNRVSSLNGGDGAGESLALDIEAQYHIPYARSCCANYPTTGQLVDWVESLGRRGVEVNLPPNQTEKTGFDLLTFVMDRAAAATCTPTIDTGELALKASPNPGAPTLGVVRPGEEVIVDRWSPGANTAPQSNEVWLSVTLSRPDDGRKGWMFSREANGAQARCSFNVDDPSSFPLGR